mmetsp:Transcript_82237/g.180783  ORF Transcript_82237/g.180783 Transcript_82237/m.180783 type:complete len:205 (+) Transcript_82237:124-738(+)
MSEIEISPYLPPPQKTKIEQPERATKKLDNRSATHSSHSRQVEKPADTLQMHWIIVVEAGGDSLHGLMSKLVPAGTSPNPHRFLLLAVGTPNLSTTTTTCLCQVQREHRLCRQTCLASCVRRCFWGCLAFPLAVAVTFFLGPALELQFGNFVLGLGLGLARTVPAVVATTLPRGRRDYVGVVSIFVVDQAVFRTRGRRSTESRM